MQRIDVKDVITQLYNLTHPKFDSEKAVIDDYKAMVRALDGVQPGGGVWVCPKCSTVWPVKHCRICLQETIDKYNDPQRD